MSLPRPTRFLLLLLALGALASFAAGCGEEEHETEVPEILHVWLHLETVIVRVHVGADWTFRITPDALEKSYMMEELGRKGRSFELHYAARDGGRSVLLIPKGVT